MEKGHKTLGLSKVRSIESGPSKTSFLEQLENIYSHQYEATKRKLFSLCLPLAKKVSSEQSNPGLYFLEA